MPSLALRHNFRVLLFVSVTGSVAACGLELQVGAGIDDDYDEAIGPSSSGMSGSSGTQTGSSGSAPGSSSGSPSSSSSTSSSSGETPDDSGAPDARDPVDAEPDAPPPLVCTPRKVEGRFCGNNAVTCQDVRNSSNYASVFMPSGSAIGQAYLNDSVETAPFTFEVGTEFYRANGSGVVAVFLGGSPANQGDLCSRLDALADGEAAVVFWRQSNGNFQLRILTDCAGSPWQPSTPSSDAPGYVRIVYDGAKLTASGKANTAYPATVEREIVLAPSVRAGVVVQASNESFLISHMTVSCP